MKWATSDPHRTIVTRVSCIHGLSGTESDSIIASLADGAKDRVRARPREPDSFRGLAFSSAHQEYSFTRARAVLPDDESGIRVVLRTASLLSVSCRSQIASMDLSTEVSPASRRAKAPQSSLVGLASPSLKVWRTPAPDSRMDTERYEALLPVLRPRDGRCRPVARPRSPRLQRELTGARRGTAASPRRRKGRRRRGRSRCGPSAAARCGR